MKTLIILTILASFIACSKEDAKHSLMLKYSKDSETSIFNYKIDVINVSKDDTTFIHLDTLLYEKVEQVYSNGDYKIVYGSDDVSDSSGVIIKTTPFGEILYSRNNTSIKNQLDESRNIEKLLLKFYPMLPYKKVLEGETWNRSQVMHTEEQEFWGDLNLNKRFKLLKVSDGIAEIDMTIRSASILSKKMDENIKMDVDIVVKGKTFFNIAQGNIEKMEIKSTIIKTTKEEKIFSQRDMKWNRKQ